MKFYVKSGIAYVNSSVVPVMDIRVPYISDNYIQIASLSSSFTITEKVPIIELEKEDGSTYADLAELQTALPFFFITEGNEINFSEYLTNNGENNAIGKYKNSATVFKYTHQVGTPEIKVSILSVMIADNTKFNYDKYGTIDLNNGVSITKNDASGGVIHKIVNDNVMRCFDYEFAGFKIEYRDLGKGGYLRFLSAKLNLNGLSLKDGESIQITLEDNFNKLEEHKFKIIGHVFRG